MNIVLLLIGKQCCVLERRINRVFMASKAIEIELEYMKELTFCQQRGQIFVLQVENSTIFQELDQFMVQRQSICYFLSKIDLQNDNIATAYILNESRTASEYDQYQQIQEEIVHQLQDKCDYGIYHIDFWISLCDIY